MPALDERAGIATLAAFASALTTLTTARTTALATFTALASATLARTSLTGIALAGVTLSGIALTGIALAGIALTGVTLSGIALARFTLTGVSARSQIITHQVFLSLWGVWHSRANREAKLTGRSLRSATRLEQAGPSLVKRRGPTEDGCWSRKKGNAYVSLPCSGGDSRFAVR